MGNLHLVTGYAGEAHVTSSDQGSLYEALIRGGQFVMDSGEKFSASIVTNNQVRVSDGELMMQGRHVKLTPGSYAELAVENGAQGYLRHDLIVARYTRNTNTGIEDCNLVVLKGTAAESAPTDPEYVTGNINAEGALQHDFPLYRLTISGLTLTGIEALFEPQSAIYDEMLPRSGGKMSGKLDMSDNKITGLKDPTSSSDAVNLGYMEKQLGNVVAEAVSEALQDAKDSGAFDGPAGPAGEDGKTPVKGTDYYTEADKAEMVDLVLAALPTWSGGDY